MGTTGDQGQSQSTVTLGKNKRLQKQYKLFQQKNTMIMNVYVPNITAPKYIKKKDRLEDRDNTFRIGHFNTPTLSVMSRKK